MRALRYILAAIVPLCVLLWMPARPALILALGDEARLAARPVDPRDLFRGDYVALSFEAENMPLSAFSLLPFISLNPIHPHEGDVFYISLKKDDGKDGSGLHVPTMVTSAPPPNGLYLRARVGSHSYRGDSVPMDLGPSLKRFYVPEGTGLRLERAGRLAVTVRVWRGEAVIVSADAAL